MTISCLSNNSANIIERTLNGSGTNFDGRQKIVLCRTWMSSIFYRRVETWSPTRQVSYIKIHRIVEKKLLLWFFICKVGSYFLMMKKVSLHVLYDAFILEVKRFKNWNIHNSHNYLLSKFCRTEKLGEEYSDTSVPLQSISLLQKYSVHYLKLDRTGHESMVEICYLI